MRAIFTAVVAPVSLVVDAHRHARPGPSAAAGGTQSAGTTSAVDPRPFAEMDCAGGIGDAGSPIVRHFR